MTSEHLQEWLVDRIEVGEPLLRVLGFSRGLNRQRGVVLDTLANRLGFHVSSIADEGYRFLEIVLDCLDASLEVGPLTGATDTRVARRHRIAEEVVDFFPLDDLLAVANQFDWGRERIGQGELELRAVDNHVRYAITSKLEQRLTKMLERETRDHSEARTRRFPRSA